MNDFKAHDVTETTGKRRANSVRKYEHEFIKNSLKRGPFKMTLAIQGGKEVKFESIDM